MLKQEGGGSAGVGGVTGGGGCRWARVCDSCRASASVVYCRADVAYLCGGCDARIHAANRVASRHERVWVCEACENAPAAFTCKADAASLCTICDADIHSANPLARRHHRDPILPISGCLYGPPETLLGRTSAGVVAAGDNFLGQEESEEIEEDEEEEEEGDNETESWLLLNNPVQVKNNNHNNNNNYNQSSCNGYVFGGGDVDEYLDLVEYNNSCTSTDHQYSVHHHHQQFHNQQQNQLELEINNSDASDSVVPDHHHQQQQQQNFQLEMENEASKVGFGYTGTIDISNSVSLSSMDASIVPDSTMNDISNSHSRAPKGTIDLFSSPPLQIPPHQCNPMDREARVLRYREKRKTRKFEKTIRYASRKAYAETRPRIKGRFAKRTDVEVEVDQIFSTSLMADNEYGVVPSF